MNEEHGIIKIPKELLNKIELRIKDTEFKSVEEYVTFVLEEVVKDEDDDVEKKEDIEETFSEEDEEKVKARLRALGYLD